MPSGYRHLEATEERLIESDLFDVRESASTEERMEARALLNENTLPAIEYIQYPPILTDGILEKEKPSWTARGPRWQQSFPLLQVLIPSFLQRTDNRPSRPLHSTAYLDGLRGVAALFVCIDHFMLNTFIGTRAGYGSDQTGASNWFLMLPMVRIFYSGRSMVCIFFAVSGYALSYKSLKLRRSRNFDSLFDTLASSTFRRFFRLYLPVIVADTIVQFMSYIEMLSIDLPGSPGRDDPFWMHVKALWTCLRQTSDPLREHPYLGYSVQLWTIPLEFRGSLLIYIGILGLAKMKGGVRMAVESFLVVWFLYTARWDLFLFQSGMLLADVQLWQEVDKQALNRVSTESDIRSRLTSKSIWILPFLIGIFLCCQPSNFSITPGYRFLAAHVPSLYVNIDEFWPSVGGVMIVISVAYADYLQCIFTSRFAQYLGKISFSIYIVHVPVQFAIKDRLERFFWSITGTETTAGYFVGFLLMLVVTMPLIFWAADLFWRVIDEPSVEAARRLAEKCTLAE